MYICCIASEICRMTPTADKSLEQIEGFVLQNESISATAVLLAKRSREKSNEEKKN